MEITAEHKTFELHHASGSDRTGEWFWQAVHSPLQGLCAAVSSVPGDGPAVRVYTAGLGPYRHYTPAGTHAPVQVQAVCFLEDGRVRPDMLSVNDEFAGPTPMSLPQACVDAVRDDVVAFVTSIVALSPSFAGRWDEVAAQTAYALRALNKAVRTREELRRQVVSAVDAVFGAEPVGTGVSTTELADKREMIAAAVEKLVGDALTDVSDTLAPGDIEVPSGARVVAELHARLASEGHERVRRHERLSEVELVAMVLAELVCFDDGAGLRQRLGDAVRRTYDACVEANYTSGYFPDRSVADERRDVSRGDH